MKTKKKIGSWMAAGLAIQLFFPACLFAQMLNVVPSPEEYYLNLLKLQKTGSHQQVMAESIKLIETYPQFARAYSKLIESAIKLNLLQSVGAYFETALKKNPANAQAHYGLALVYRRLGEHNMVIEQARLCQQKALEFAPAYTVLADAYQSLNKPDEAEAFFKSIPRGHPGFAAANYGLGYLLYQIKPPQSRWAESLAAFDQALATEPVILEAQEYKAVILYFTNRYSEALAIYQSLFETAKARSDLERQTRAIISMGTLRRILGEHATALENLDRFSYQFTG